MRYVYEVLSPGVTPAIEIPGFDHVPYMLFRAGKGAFAGQFHLGFRQGLPEDERLYLEPQGLKSVLMLPVFIGQNWYGYIGFDDTRESRPWSDNDIRLLKTASEIIGLYLGRKRSEQKIREYQTQLRNLASELSIAEERERKQLATQLHDTIVQNLAISKINMGMLKSEMNDTEVQTKIEKIISLVDLSIKQSRNLMNELSPPMLFDLGIAEAIEGLIDDLNTRFGLEAALECRYKFLKLPQNMTILLYQSIRELLMNVIKHSGDKTAIIVIKRVPEGLDVRVTDKGKGFDPSKALTAPGIDKGFGLFSVKERLSYIDGNLQVDSIPDKGTTIRLFIPVTDEQIEESGGEA
jgi:signal transduction histidine kinase